MTMTPPSRCDIQFVPGAGLVTIELLQPQSELPLLVVKNTCSDAIKQDGTMATPSFPSSSNHFAN